MIIPPTTDWTFMIQLLVESLLRATYQEDTRSVSLSLLLTSHSKSFFVNHTYNVWTFFFPCLPPGVAWTWLKFWCFDTSSGLCCQWSSSLGPPGSLCLDWATCSPASFFCCLGPSYWSNHPGPASPCGTVSSSITWQSLYLRICYQ